MTDIVTENRLTLAENCFFLDFQSYVQLSTSPKYSNRKLTDETVQKHCYIDNSTVR